MSKPKTPRLPKNPDLPDYVVEYVTFGEGHMQVLYRYFRLRKEARDFARHVGADRIRIFRMKFTLVSDSKRKGGAR